LLSFAQICGGGGAITADAARTFINEVLIPNKDKIQLKGLLEHLLEGAGRLTVVIDEANLAFNRDKLKDWTQACHAVEALVALSKQDKLVNVIFACSEYALPYLMNKNMMFNLNNLDEINYFGEIPPNDMFELLTTKWDVKENLALALVDTYGGHIKNVTRAVTKLALNPLPEGSFMVNTAYGASIHDVVPCLRWAVNNQQEKKMHIALTALARDGYFKVNDFSDPIAEVISQHNVGGFVTSGGFAVGIPKEVWEEEDCEWICVPSTQAMRVIIAHKILR
jgi:hypothetical protein